MPPKIEIVSDHEKSNIIKSNSKSKVKNVFLPKASTTIKRAAKDIYQNKDEILKAQKLGNRPIDILFRDIESKIEGDLEALTIDELFSRIGTSQYEHNSNARRMEVINKLFDYVIQIRDESNKVEIGDSNIIRISLYDMKILSKLINLIIILGIYPALSSFNIGIPIDKRRLNTYSNTHKKMNVDVLKHCGGSSYSDMFSFHERLLCSIYDNFMKIFQSKSDVKDLLLKGTGYSDFLTLSIALITVPYFSSECRNKHKQEFSTVISFADTFELFETYTLLISSPCPAYYKQFVMSNLQLLHFNSPNGDGLLTLIEFLLGLRDNEQINVEKYDHIANVVLSKPKAISTVSYFSSMGEQFYELLGMINRPIITSCVSYVIEKLWNKNPSIVRDFLFKLIWNSFLPTDKQLNNEVLVNERDLNNNINVCLSLSKNVSDHKILKELYDPIILSLWEYYAFIRSHKINHEVIKGLFITVFSVSELNPAETCEKDEVYYLDLISKNVLYNVDDDFTYMLGPNGLVQIVASRKDALSTESNLKVQSFVTTLDQNISYFMDLLSNLEENLISRLFVRILKRWISLNKISNKLEEPNPFLTLIDLRLLEEIGSNHKESLCNDPTDMLTIVKDLTDLQISALSESMKNNGLHQSDIGLNTNSDSDDETDEADPISDSGLKTEVLSTVLELLSAVLQEFYITEESLTDKELLKEILDNITGLKSQTAESSIKNSCESLAFSISQILTNEKTENKTDDNEKNILKRAVRSINDPLVPIRAHGLYLLRSLIMSKSKIIDLNFVIELHLIQLKDKDPFIYLNVIKGLQSLIEIDDEKVIKILTQIYVSSADKDECLRIGEVLLKYVQISGQLFSGSSANRVMTSALSIAKKPSKADTIQNDKHVRMSAVSILGSCFLSNSLGISEYISEALDCAFGILTFEKSEDDIVLRRAAIYLIHDLVCGVSELKFDIFPNSEREKVVTTLNYIQATDNDLLVRENASKTLDMIEMLFEDAISLQNENNE